MADEKNEIVTTNDKLAEKPKNPFAARAVGVGAKIQAAQQSGAYDPLLKENRIGIVFDDSGSMAGKAIIDAKAGVTAFVTACNPNNTGLALYHFGQHQYSLTVDLPAIDLLAQGLSPDYGTPIWHTLDQLINCEKITRAVLFSDGEPTDGHIKETHSEKILEQYVEKKIPIDTVYIGLETNARAMETMKYIAEKTGGIFMFFKDTANFRKNFKYLAPAYRAMLSDGNFRKALEEGK